MSIKPYIDLIRATAGTNDKIAILKKNKDNATLKEWFRLAADPRIKFNVKQIPPYTPNKGSTAFTLDSAMAELDVLVKRIKTGNDARFHLQRLLEDLNTDDALLLEDIINKKPDCGVTKKTCNKVWGSSFIKDKPYMRCDVPSKDTCSKIPFPAFLEMKMDGQYMDIFTFQDEDTVIFESRQGVEYSFLGELEEELLALGYLIEDNNPEIKDPVFQGEALVVDADGNIIERGSNNGKVGKGKKEKNTISKAEAESIIFVLWDVLPKAEYDNGICKIQRSKRLKMLKEAIEELDSDRLRLVTNKVVNSLAEAFKQNSEWQQAGEEGSILKSAKAIWKSGTSKEQLKMKVFWASDYKAVGIVEGTGKHKGSMGAVVYESSCGTVRGQVGGGWKEKFGAHDDSLVRQYIWDNWETEFKGRILTIGGNDLTKADGSDTWAISHPRIDPKEGHWRDAADKAEADDYKKIKKELDAAKFISDAEE